MSGNREPGRPPSLSLDRRRLLLSGGLGVLGLNITRPSPRRRVDAGPRLPPSPIRSCILIFYYGGPSHLDTWDMKPNAPREVRGEFRPIATNVPGIQVSEHLPHSARVVDRLAIIRSLYHPMTNHNAAAFAALSGRLPAKGDLELLANDRNDPPCLGAMLSHELPERRGLPAFVALPHVMHNVVKLPGQVAGFLGSAHDPFQVSSDPNAPDFHLDELDLPDGVSLDRLGHRESLLSCRRPVPRGCGPRATTSTCTGGRRSACSTPRPSAAPSGSTRKTRSSATATAAPSTARACSWRVGWSRRASAS